MPAIDTIDTPLEPDDEPNKPADDITWIEGDFLQLYGARIGPKGIATYVALRRYKATEYMPSYQEIADLTGMSRTEAVISIAVLVAEGLVLWPFDAE